MSLRCAHTASFFLTVATLFAVLSAWVALDARADEGTPVGGVYSPGGWSTLHRGPANRKLVGPVPLAEDFDSIRVLSGASILTAPTMSPDGRTLYVTTGKAVGFGMFDTLAILGKESCLARIDRALAKV